MAMEHGNPNYDVILVGAGLSGLACANALHKAGKNILVVEAADSPVAACIRSVLVNTFATVAFRYYSMLVQEPRNSSTMMCCSSVPLSPARY